MALHHEVGKYGEQLAGIYLEKQDFLILHRNWKYSYYEIDIIGCRNDILHFIEVKTCKSMTYGFPDEHVSKSKLEKVMTAAEEYLFQHPEWKRVQYDILSICILKNQEPEFWLIEDVSL